MNVTTATLHVKCHTTSPPTKEKKETEKKRKEKKRKEKKRKEKKRKEKKRKEKKRKEKTTPLGVQHREALDDPEPGQSFPCLLLSLKAV